MKLKISILFVLSILAVCGAILAQGNPTARIAGRVLAADSSPLPGVTVRLASEQLQGIRTLVTDEGGNFISAALPPGDYEITFELEGFQKQTRKIRLNAAQSETLDVSLELAGLSEEIVVHDQAETLSTDTTSALTLPQSDIDELPVSRSLDSVVAMSPGVHATGSDGGLTISGAQSWENLFVLDGVVLNDNLTGQPLELFIEDAIQETTTASSGISAEYGRFTGGVVNAVTKSGGNQFEGSLRVGFDNESWQGKTPLTEDQIDQTNETFEATFGGPVLRDRLWFFLAGRKRDVSQTSQTQLFNQSFETSNDQDRWEGKLTAGLTQSHQIQATRMEIDEVEANVAHGGLTEFAIVTDDGTLSDTSTSHELSTISYTGTLTSSLLVEGKYSQRELTIKGRGGHDPSLTGGTVIWDFANSFVAYNDSFFCGICRPEERDNEHLSVKGSYFFSGEKAGAHDLVAGYESFSDIAVKDNHQTATDFLIVNFAGSEFRGEEIFPVFLPDFTFIDFDPVLIPSHPTDFQTDSYFVNDRWRVNNQLSINVGLRYDANDGTNQNAQKVLDDSAWSPRLGAVYSPGPASPWRFQASAGRYVGTVNNTIADRSPAGDPSVFEYAYEGPAVNADPNGPLLNSEQALGILFDWLLGVCPDLRQDPTTCSLPLSFLSIPGVSNRVGEGLTSPSADELAIGFSRRLGSGGSLRADYIHREWHDFFAIRRDLGTGQIDLGDFGFPELVADLGITVNEDDVLSRRYDAVNLLFEHRLRESVRFGGNYTWSHLRGNMDGESRELPGAQASEVLSYPEYRQLSWNAPEGDLLIDQRHKLHAWAIFDLLESSRHHLTASVMESFFSGSPYEAVGTIDPRPYVTNPGYLKPPSTMAYYFTGRGAFRTDDITRTDLALNYTLKLRSVELMLQPEVTNVFNEHGVVDVDRTVLTRQSGDRDLTNFNPFTERPVEGVHYRLGKEFGKPINESDYQTPRTFRFSVRARF